MGREGYLAAVEQGLEYIRAGDVYQVNLAHRLGGRFRGSAEALYAALVEGARPRHGLGVVSMLGGGMGRAVLSLSPELFLSFDAGTRRIVTRPMKGTRPGDGDEAELLGATKDRAELAMIVDLMRNDLGRVCEFGSVRVETAREIERHGVGRGAVLQATATVGGVVREGVGTAEILGATFPPGSVTGAPKIRAMEIIRELEGFGRGPYCGCVGTFADDGSFELGVAIRTVVIEGPVCGETGEFVDAEISYCVGAGIVADSDPESEWRETLDKARVLEPVFHIDAE
ncbi:MAG: anthranilate synthase component I family protein [Phycisphaerales bacterium]|nr:anthranilate synthase component I family protein [Phycisphaerales bacterium]